jgi:phosphocarrier protein
MSVMMLAAAQGSLITVSCEGEDEEQAMLAIQHLLEDFFGEDE